MLVISKSIFGVTDKASERILLENTVVATILQIEFSFTNRMNLFINFFDSKN